MLMKRVMDKEKGVDSSRTDNKEELQTLTTIQSQRNPLSKDTNMHDLSL